MIGLIGSGVLRTVLVALAYFTGARLGYAFAAGGVVSLWPPSGLMLGLLAVSRSSQWPATIAGGLIGSFCSDLLSGYSIPLAIAAALANGFESFVGGLVLVRFLGSPARFSTLRGVAVLVIGVVGVSNAFTAIGGAAMLNAGFGMAFGYSWLVWWVGDGLGMLIVAPVILAVAEWLRQERRIAPARTIEGLVLLTVVLASAIISVGPVRDWVVHPGPYALFPVLLWAGLRFGLAGASLSTLIVACIAIWYVSLGVGPFAIARSSSSAAIVEAYAFLAVAGASALIAAAALNERKDAIDQLAASREQYRNVVETATDPIVTIDSRNRIRLANSATERVFGFTQDELLGSDLSMLVPGATDTGMRRDGVEIPLEVSYGRAIEPEHTEMTLILRDISEKRAAERALQALEAQYRQSQKMEAIGQLAGGIAHDFNNLLTIVQVNCELLLPQLSDDRQIRNDLLQIRSAAERAAGLTRQLLAFSRRQVLEPRAMRMATAVESVKPMLDRLLGEHVEVRVSVNPGLAPVLADPGQVEQVILNLAINARDAMPAGGRLSIHLSEAHLDADTASIVDLPPGRYACLTVSDSGIGMDEATAARVFEPFFTTKPMGRGTGLGLSTVHGIVKQSGGGIRVVSRIGQGSTFEVYLPLADGPVEEVGQEARPPAPPATGYRVLVVEDEDDVGRLIRRILERRGYEVLLAASPREAMEIAEAEQAIDVLLTDVVLPEMSGRALADVLVDARPGLAVLFMSGYTDDALSDHGVLDRDLAFIEKPFTGDALIARLEQVIHRATAS